MSTLLDGWYAVAPAGAASPTQLRIGGARLVLVRLDGSWSAFSDACPHRLAPLSAGRVVPGPDGERLQCPYHGWEFGADGRCLRIPSMADGSPVPSGAFTREAAAGVEVGGAVWLPWGSPLEPAPGGLTDCETAELVELPADQVAATLCGDSAVAAVPGAPTTWSAADGSWFSVTPADAWSSYVAAAGRFADELGRVGVPAA